MRWLSGLLVAGSIAALVVVLATDDSRRDWPSWLTTCTINGIEGTARCGVVNVLESPEKPSGRRIGIRVVVVPARAQTASPDPILFLVGGPGQGAADLAAGLTARLAFLRDDRDLVLVDQRGTGGSNGLTCPPQPRATGLMGNIFDPVRLAACRDQLAQRADLTRYTTSAAAADYEAILDAIGYRQVNVWGASYGTRMGLELARRMPTRVRTLTIEGVVPPFFAWPTSGAVDAEAALLAVITDCEADTQCSSSYPTFRQDVERAFATVATQPVTARVLDPRSGETERVTFGATDLGYATRGLLYGPDALRLPHMFREAASGRFEGFAQAYVTRARALGRELATGVHLGVYCAEDLPHADLPRARQMAEGTRIGTYLIDQYAHACDVWPRAKVPDDFREPVRSAVPTLIMTGQRDPVTPPRTAHDAARTLTRTRVLTWRYGGHGFDGLANSTCKSDIIRAFVNTADLDRLDVNCMTRDVALPFQPPS